MAPTTPAVVMDKYVYVGARSREVSHEDANV